LVFDTSTYQSQKRNRSQKNLVDCLGGGTEFKNTPEATVDLARDGQKAVEKWAMIVPRRNCARFRSAPENRTVRALSPSSPLHLAGSGSVPQLVQKFCCLDAFLAKPIVPVLAARMENECQNGRPSAPYFLDQVQRNWGNCQVTSTSASLLIRGLNAGGNRHPEGMRRSIGSPADELEFPP